MKLLVSDYDGTLRKSIKSLCININYIDKFRSEGNKFVIATGRCYNSIKNETNVFDIEYDYLICNNGHIIFDDKNNILSADKLQKEQAEYIMNLLNKNNKVCITKLYGLYSSNYDFDNLLEIYASFDSVESSKEFKQYIESIMPNIHCHYVGNSLFIGNRVSKATAISYIENLENIPYENIYTIGDGSNDYEMLTEYQGYKMFKSDKVLWNQKIPTVFNYYRLVKKLTKQR